MILRIQDIGFQSYRPVWNYQRYLHNLRVAGKIPDTLILVEHPPVYTIGKNGSELHVVASQEEIRKKRIEVVHVDRGGDVTYHGPGQLVGYPVFDLHQHRQSVSWYMRTLEAVFIEVLKNWDISASRHPDYTGVWVGEAKIVALGVRISRWVTMHGFALNVNTDLRFYDGIIPCGIFHRGVTSMQEILGMPVSLQEVKRAVTEQFLKTFGFEKFETNAESFSDFKNRQHHPNFA